MFKLKKGNVIQKLNNMDRKKAYTIAAIILVCVVVCISLASFMGSAGDESFDGMSTRGYDLAQMPFLNDEAEAYLLASKYPDMQDNGASMLYSGLEKQARQEEDAANAEDEANSGDEEEEDSDNYNSSRGDDEDDDSYSGGGRGYGGGGYGGGRGKTEIGSLSSASMSTASGSGINSTWGAPRGDFSPYKSQDKGSEVPAQFKEASGKKALSQFAQTSRAAAGLKDAKAANAKRALMGGNIQGSEAFTGNGVDLSKASGLNLDTNAPTSSADLSNLDKKIDNAAKNNQNKQNPKEKKTFWDKLMEQVTDAAINAVANGVTKLMNMGIDGVINTINANEASKEWRKGYASMLQGLNSSNCKSQECLNTLGPVLSAAGKDSGWTQDRDGNYHAPTGQWSAAEAVKGMKGATLTRVIKENGGQMAGELQMGTITVRDEQGNERQESSMVSSTNLNAFQVRSLERFETKNTSQGRLDAANRAARESAERERDRKARDEAEQRNRQQDPCVDSSGNRRTGQVVDSYNNTVQC